MRRGRFALAFVALVAALAVPTASIGANNPAASASLSSQADWISPAQIVVYVTVSCAPYFNGTTNGAGSVFVNVNQAVGPAPGGFGSSSQPYTCDGQNHRLALSVSPGPWQLGPALAVVQACGFTCDFFTKQIKITRA